MSKMLRLLAVALMFMISLSTTFAQGEVVCESDVIVERYDSLWKIAQKAYGDGFAYPKIVEATNAKAAMDSSYATINNANFIRPGWKLCLPSLASNTTSSAPSQQAESSSDTSTTSSQASSNVTKITFLQINDVYEMMPTNNLGGIARLATLRKELLAANPNTYTVLAGDLFSPSALGTAKVGEETLAGKQMVAAMNALGLDYATLGNHEFDVSEKQFHQRLEESNARWISANAFDANGEPFPNISKNVIFTVTDDANREVRVGLFSVMLDSNKKPYVTYTNHLEAAKEQVEALKDEVDILVALTHLSISQDIELAEHFKDDIDLIMGGHEHEHHFENIHSIPITKADANAHSAYIVELEYNHDTAHVAINAKLQPITSDIPDDEEVANVVKSWQEKGFEGFRKLGFEPKEIIATVTEALDGTEASVRNKSTRLTELINESMLMAAPDTELSIYNGGSIRIDDTLGADNSKTDMTQYDVIRILPFGGILMSVEMKGSLLQEMLEQSEARKGSGSYLQTANVTQSNGIWMINGTALNPETHYQVAINDYLVGKQESEHNQRLWVKGEHGDLRVALIDQLKKTYGGK